MSILSDFHTRFVPVAILAASALWAGCASEPLVDTTVGHSSPAISVEATEAIHELGVSNASIPADGLLCAGQLSQEQMDALSALGFASFVSLRVATESRAGWEEEHAAEAGIDFQRQPVAGAAGVNEAAARALAEVMAGAERPMVLYCGSSNRVGALLALKAFYVEKMPAEAALAFGKSAGLKSLEPKVRAQISE